MAYIDFADAGTAPALRRDTPHIDAPRHDPLPSQAPARLSALEWSVVAIARNDRLSSLRAPGRMSVALATLFGAKSTNRLADERLEALRRMAVLTWHHGAAVAGRDIKAFLAAGFEAAHYELLLASIAVARTNRGRHR